MLVCLRSTWKVCLTRRFPGPCEQGSRFSVVGEPGNVCDDDQLPGNFGTRGPGSPRGKLKPREGKAPVRAPQLSHSLHLRPIVGIK